MTTFSIEGLLYLILYRLQRHYFIGWTLTRWLVILLLALPVSIFAGIIPGGMILLVVSGIFSVTMLAFIWIAKRMGYHRFIVDNNHPFGAIIAQPLPASEKIPIRVSGTFAVSNHQQNFVDESAFYQSFETRERVLMVNIPVSRFLFLSQSPQNDVGWWYNFFAPAQVRSVNFGSLKFGLHPRPALQLDVQPDGSDKLISFSITTASPDDMAQILTDLKADCIL